MRTIKTIVTAVIGMLLTAACTTDKGNKLTYHIEGTAEGLADGQQLQLANDEGEPFDTIVIKNGKFTYDGKADSVACYVINVMSDEFNSVNYFTEPGTIAITITATPGQSTVSGTIANDALQRLSEATNPYYEKIHEIEEIIYKDTVLSKDSEWALAERYMQVYSEINKKIAAVNQAEIQEVSLLPYLAVFKGIGCNTLGDIHKIIKDNFEGAYQIACYQMGLTDLDIISSSIGPQNLCIAYILKKGWGKGGVRYFFDLLHGKKQSNETVAEMIVEQAKELPFMNQ